MKMQLNSVRFGAVYVLTPEAEQKLNAQQDEINAKYKDQDWNNKDTGNNWALDYLAAYSDFLKDPKLLDLGANPRWLFNNLSKEISGASLNHDGYSSILYTNTDAPDAREVRSWDASHFEDFSLQKTSPQHNEEILAYHKAQYQKAKAEGRLQIIG